MTRSSIAICAAVLVAFAALAGATGGVTAQSTGDESSWADNFVDDDPDDWPSATIAGLKGGFAATKYRITAFDMPYLGDSAASSGPSAAEVDARAAQTYFNNHSSEFVAYANNRTSASSEWDVFAVTFDRADSSKTVYLVANTTDNGTEYASAAVVNATTRTVDKNATLSGFASKNADDELKTFHEDFVEPNKTVSRAYMARMAAQYGGYVEAPFLLGGDN